VTTDQLDALIRAAEDEARFPVTAGRAAVAAVDHPKAEPPRADRFRQGIQVALVTGIISGLAAAGVVSLFSAGGWIAVTTGVFFAVTAAHLLVAEAVSFLRRRP